MHLMTARVLSTRPNRAEEMEHDSPIEGEIREIAIVLLGEIRDNVREKVIFLFGDTVQLDPMMELSTKLYDAFLMASSSCQLLTPDVCLLFESKLMKPGGFVLLVPI